MMEMAKEIDRPVDLVTGATSKLGSLIVKKLIEKGHEVRVIIREEPTTSEEWKKLPPGAKPYIADITLKRSGDEKNLQAACSGVNNIFHIASAVYNYKHTYDDFIEINVIGTENLINAALSANKGKPVHFISAGSVTVYGYRRPGEILTEESETHPESNYSKSKLMQEEVIKAYGNSNPELKYTILRYSTLYGPGYENSFFKVFKLLKEGALKYPGGAENHLPLVHVDDAVEAAVEASDSPKSLDSTYNVSDGDPHTLKELFDSASRLLGVPPPTKKVSLSLARIRGKISNLEYDEYEFLTSDRIISIDKISSELGFKPKVNLERGGAEMVGAFLHSAKQ